MFYYAIYSLFVFEGCNIVYCAGPGRADVTTGDMQAGLLLKQDSECASTPREQLNLVIFASGGRAQRT